MSAALVSLSSSIDFPAEPGLSPRAIRSIYRVYCRLADSSGNFKFGIRGSKVAQLADYSLATVRRAQRYLVEHGYLTKVKVGGGRVSTRWRIVLDKLGIASEPDDDPPPRHTTGPSSTPQQSSPDTALRRTQISVRSSGRGPAGMSPPVLETCRHGGDASLMEASGLPRCAICRREVLRT